MKRIPQRTCVTCRTVRPKQHLIRVVYSSATGRAEVDPSGKKPGRGAYLCSTRDCWGKRVTRNRLEHALHGRIGIESWADIVRFGAKLEGDVGEPSPEVGETG